MFKKSNNSTSSHEENSYKSLSLLALCACLCTVPSACRLLPTLPPVDLTQPGWSVKQGQAVWKFKKDAPEIAGEILLATKGAGQTYVQFTKGPFPMATGQTTSRGWQLERGDSKARYSGPGRPPTRIIILQLAGLLAGQPPPPGWSWQQTEKNWRLENKKTGEFLEGFLE